MVVLQVDDAELTRTQSDSVSYHPLSPCPLRLGSEASVTIRICDPRIAPNADLPGRFLDGDDGIEIVVF